jgi:hypothetical protein
MHIKRDIPILAHMHFLRGKKNITFAGGGVCWFWQAGVVKALQQQYDLRNEDICFSGASAGSISSVLAVCNVNIDDAIEAALRLADEAGVFTRMSLFGIWGGLIERWLNELLPDDCHIICSGRVFISITTLSPFRRKVVSTFTSRKELIQVCLCSIHLPFFLDGKFSRMYNGDACVDGSLQFFLNNTHWVVSDQEIETDAFILHHTKDKQFMKQKWRFLEIVGKDALHRMITIGFEYGLRRMRNRTNLTPPTPLCGIMKL